MALLGDLVVLIDADSSKFEQGIGRSGKQLQQFEQSSTAALLSSNRFRGGLTQASFAVDDFFGVLAAGGGVGAAIRSTTTNIGTLVTMVNPLAGIATTLGLTLGSVLIPKLFDTGDADEDSAEQFEAFQEKLREIDQQVRDRQEQLDQSVKITTIFDANGIAAEFDRIQQRLELLRAQRGVLPDDPNEAIKHLNAIDEEVERLITQIARLEHNQGLAEFNRQLEQMRQLEGIGEIDSLDSVNEGIEESRQRLEALDREMLVIGRHLEELHNTDPLQLLQEQDEIFAEQDKRLEEMKRFQEQLDALIQRRQELEFDKADKELLEGTSLDLEQTLDQFDALDRLEAEAERLRDAFALEIETDPLKRSLLQVEQEFERRMEEIREKFDGALEVDLLTQAEAARQAKIDDILGDDAAKQDRLDRRQDQFAGFAERGSAEAFSAILKATRGNSELSAIAKATNATAKTNDKVAKAVEKQNMPKPTSAVTVEVLERF